MLKVVSCITRFSLGYEQREFVIQKNDFELIEHYSFAPNQEFYTDLSDPCLAELMQVLYYLSYHKRHV